MAELRTLTQKGDNFVLVAISVDPADKTLALKKKIASDGKGDINFPLLSDSRHTVIDSYGLYDPAYAGQSFDGIPHPAVYVVDENRKVVWARVESDYRRRPTIDEIRSEISKLRN